MNSNLSRLPVGLSDLDVGNLYNTFGNGPVGELKLQASILANIAALVRIPVKLVGTTFTRPGNTTAYASGDIVANSTTAGSVAPVSFKVARNSGTAALIRRALLSKSGTGTTNASFRVHLYSTSPTPTNGDNGAWTTTLSGYLGALDVTVDRAFSDGAFGAGIPVVGTEIPVSADTDGTVFALIEARGAYTPASSETFTLFLEVNQS